MITKSFGPAFHDLLSPVLQGPWTFHSSDKMLEETLSETLNETVDETFNEMFNETFDKTCSKTFEGTIYKRDEDERDFR